MLDARVSMAPKSLRFLTSCWRGKKGKKRCTCDVDERVRRGRFSAMKGGVNDSKHRTEKKGPINEILF